MISEEAYIAEHLKIAKETAAEEYQTLLRKKAYEDLRETIAIESKKVKRHPWVRDDVLPNLLWQALKVAGYVQGRAHHQIDPLRGEKARQMVKDLVGSIDKWGVTKP